MALAMALRRSIREMARRLPPSGVMRPTAAAAAGWRQPTAYLEFHALGGIRAKSTGDAAPPPSPSPIEGAATTAAASTAHSARNTSPTEAGSGTAGAFMPESTADSATRPSLMEAARRIMASAAARSTSPIEGAETTTAASTAYSERKPSPTEAGSSTAGAMPKSTADSATRPSLMEAARRIIASAAGPREGNYFSTSFAVVTVDPDSGDSDHGEALCLPRPFRHRPGPSPNRLLMCPTASPARFPVRTIYRTRSYRSAPMQSTGTGTTDDIRQVRGWPLRNFMRRFSVSSAGTADDKNVPEKSSEVEIVDESTDNGFVDAKTYVERNWALEEVQVLNKKSWIVSESFKVIARSLSNILKNQHSVGKSLQKPLDISTIYVSLTNQKTQLRGVTFTGRDFCWSRVQQDYKYLSECLKQLIEAPGGDQQMANVPESFLDYLKSLDHGLSGQQEESSVANNWALVPHVDSLIDEYSARGCIDAKTFIYGHHALIKVPIPGRANKIFWKISEPFKAVCRSLAIIMKSQHSLGKSLLEPLDLSHIWVRIDDQSVELRGAKFSEKGFCLDSIKEDYRNVANVVKKMIELPGGDQNLSNAPPDFDDYLQLLEHDFSVQSDEFLVTNNCALLPIRNRTEVFLRFYGHIRDRIRWKNYRTYHRILTSIGHYTSTCVATASSNTLLNQWLTGPNASTYGSTPLDQLRYQRNVRSHYYQHSHDEVEEVLYLEYPSLIQDMQKALHKEGELIHTDIENKFGRG